MGLPEKRRIRRFRGLNNKCGVIIAAKGEQAKVWETSKESIWSRANGRRGPEKGPLWWRRASDAPDWEPDHSRVPEQIDDDATEGGEVSKTRYL